MNYPQSNIRRKALSALIAFVQVVSAVGAATIATIKPPALEPLVGAPETAAAHNLQMEIGMTAIDPSSRPMFDARLASGQPLIQAGDTITVVFGGLNFIGTEDGLGGYFDFYPLTGTQVVNAEYVVPVPGGYAPVPIKKSPGFGVVIGTNDPTGQLKNFTLGPNINGVTSKPTSAGNVSLGTLYGFYGDTGIFYSTDPRTGFGSFPATGNIVNNRGEDVDNDDFTGQPVPLTRFDVDQLRALGMSSPQSCIFNSACRGTPPWGLGSPVAGPQSGYQWQFVMSNPLASLPITSAVAGPFTYTIATGPFQRIRYPGSQISNDTPGNTSGAVFDTSKDASNVGFALSPSSPLPATTSWNDITSTKLVRFALGRIVNGQPEYARIAIKINSTSSILDAQGCPRFTAMAFSGDAGINSGGKDHLWRYFNPTIKTVSPCLLLFKEPSKVALATNEVFTYSLRAFNTGAVTLTNVIIRDTLPAGLQYISAVPAPTSGTNPQQWNIASLPPNRGWSAVLTVRALTPGIQVNNLTLTSNQGGAGTQAIVGVAVPIMGETKSVAPASVAPGGTITYTIRLRNTGTGNSSVPIRVFEFLPAGFSFGSLRNVTVNGANVTSGSTAVAAGTNVTISLPSTSFVAPNNEAVIVFTAQVGQNTTAGSYCNNFNVAYGSTTDQVANVACVSVGGGAIGDTVFRDWNGNGAQDPGEEGLPGAVVQLVGPSGTITTTTNASGTYLFNGLVTGNYTVTVISGTTGFTATQGAGGYTVPLATNQQFMTADFGFTPAGTGSIGDTVFKDVGNDGTFNAGIDTGIQNVTVWLYEDTNGNGRIDAGQDTLIFTQTTDANGNYLFTNLATGLNYIAAVDTSDPQIAEAFNPNAFIPSTPVLRPVPSLAGSVLTADFGFFENRPSSIGDQVFIDANGNGVYDAGEQPLPAIGVSLFQDLNVNGRVDPGEPLLQTTQTSPTGTYAFTGLGPGSYLVAVDTSDPDLPDGLLPTQSLIVVPNLPVNTNLTTVDFPFVPVIGKQVSRTFANAGDQLVYTVTASYPGPSGLTNAFISDPIPLGTTYVAGSANAGGVLSGTNVLWDLGDNTPAIPGQTAPIGTALCPAPAAIITATLDTFIEQDNPTDFFGTGTKLSTNPRPANRRASLLFFPITGTVPATATITSARVFVTSENSRSNHVAEIRNMITPWTEGTAATNGATWNDSNGTSTAGDWVTGTFGAQDYGAVVFGTLRPAGGNRYVSSDITPLAQTWLGSNRGMGMIPTGTDTSDADWSSRDNTNDPSRKPYVLVRYLVPTVGGCSGNTVIGSVADTYVRQDAATTNYGNAAEMETQPESGEFRHSLVQFEMGVLPPGAIITSAVLSLTVTNDRNNHFDQVRRMNTAWTETGATWNRRNGINPWAGGGAFSAADYGTTVFGTITPTVQQVYTVGVTSAVNDWVNNGVPNNGFVLLSTGSDNGQAKYATKEETTISERPALIVQWFLPPATTAPVRTQLSASPLLRAGPASIVNVTMQISSSANITNMVPPATLQLFTTGGVTATKVSGPTPAGPISTSNSVAVFTYSYIVTPSTTPGTINFTGRPTATNYPFANGTSEGLIIAPPLTFTAQVNTPITQPLVSNVATIGDDNVLSDVPSEPAETALSASIGDTVWLDLDRNGAQNLGEPGVGGVVVTVISPTGQIFTATTDAFGNYTIFGLRAGTYTVTYDLSTLPAGYAPTTAITRTAVLTSATQFKDADFGVTPPGLGAIGDTVWLDANNDGILNNTEQGLPGITVRLYADVNGNSVIDAGDTVLQSTATDATGYYTFTNLYGGPYLVQVDTSSTVTSSIFGISNGITATLGAAMTPTLGTSITRVVSLTTNSTVTDTIDFGFNWSGFIGDYGWYDSNGNGVLDGGDEGPARDMVVELVYDVNGNGEYDIGEPLLVFLGPFNTGTGPDGLYIYPHLPPGNYIVEGEGQAIPAPASSGVLSGTVGVMMNTTPYEIPFTLGPGQAITTFDFGFAAGAIVEGHVWYDENSSGTRDPIEPTGFGGVVVTLTGVISTPTGFQNVVLTTTTDSSGEYEFPPVLPGTFTVTYNTAAPVLANFPLQTTPAVQTFDLRYGEERIIDFGRDYSGAIGDLVWVDGNASAGQDPGEPGIAGATVLLYQGGALVGATTSGVTGSYLFNGLAAGTYTVTVLTSTIPPSLTQITTPPGNVWTVNLITNTQVFSADFGYRSLTPVFTVTGRVVSDTTGVIGAVEGTDPGLKPNVLAQVVYTPAGGLPVTVTTPIDANGNYTVTSIPQGSNVAITVVPASVPLGYTNSTTPTLTINNITANTPNQNFGFVFAPASLAGTVVVGNGNGIAEVPTETVVSGVTVTLLYAGPDGLFGTGGDDQTFTTTTNLSGQYVFTSLLPGAYFVYQMVPAGFNPLADRDGGTPTEIFATLAISQNLTGQDFELEIIPADLQVTKRDSADPIVAGNRLTYTLVVTNAGPGVANNVIVSDSLPAGASYVSASPAPSSTNPVTWSLGTLQINATRTLTVVVNVDRLFSGTLTNTASITSSTPDITPTNNTATEPTGVTPGVGSITGTVFLDANGNGQLDPGEPGLPNITVLITDSNNLTYTVTTDANGIYTQTNVTIGTATVDIVNPPAGFVDTTNADPSTVNVPPAGTGNAGIDGYQPQADLRINKTNNLTQVVPGTLVTYTIVVTNSGPISVTGARITDTVPVTLANAGWACVAGAGAACSTPASGSGSLNGVSVTLAVNSVLTFTLTGTVWQTATGNIANTALVTPPLGITDPITNNNTSTDDDPLVPQADLQITKTNGVNGVVPGTSTTYRITVTNNGPSAVTGATVTDTLPALLTGASWTCATCTPASGSGDISVTVDLLSGQSAVIVLTGTVPATATGTLTNTAVVAPPPGVTDTVPGNNTSTDPDPTDPRADLQIDKGNGVGSVVPGDRMTYTIVVTNAGPSAVVGARITDTLPVTLSNASWACTAGAGTVCGTASGLGNIENISVTMAPVSVLTFTVTGTVISTATGFITNTAVVTVPAGVTDPTPSNNTSSDNDPLTPFVNLGIFKTNNQSTVVPGTRITYTIVVSNSGPSAATGVAISDAIPSTLLSPAWSCAGTTCNSPTSGSGNISTSVTLLPGARVTFTVVATLSLGATGRLTNTASLTPPPGVTNTNPVTESTDGDPITPAVITGTIFVDTNGNGQLNGGEPPLTGVSVIITDSQGVTRSVPVDSSGNYSVTLPPGPFTATVDPATVPPGYVPTTPTTRTGTAVPDTITPTNPVGYQPRGDVTGIVFLDTNGNGSPDPGEGLPNVQVVITDAFGVPVIVTTTASGQYTATQVPSGTAIVDVVNSMLPNGVSQTVGTDPSTVVVNPGVVNNAGLDGYRQIGDVTGTVFLDVNGNGIKDAGEGLLNVQIVITDSAGLTNTFWTDANGLYTFTAVTSGTAVVNVIDSTLPNGVTQTVGTDPTNVTVLPNQVNFEENNGYRQIGTVTGFVYNDVDGNGSYNPLTDVVSGGVTVILTDSAGLTKTATTETNGFFTFTGVTSGTARVDLITPPPGTQTQGTDPTNVTVLPNQNNFEQNNGFFNPGTVTGVVFEDTNGDGDQDPGEPGLPGVTVMITDSQGVMTTTVTIAGGFYTFTNVPSGTAIVDVVNSTLPAGYVDTTNVDPSSVTVNPGVVNNAGKDGYQPRGDVTGVVFEDTNGNQIQDPGEPGLPGVTVLITDSQNVTRTVLTGPTGVYTATGVPSGTAIVDVVNSTLPAGYVDTTNVDPSSVTVNPGVVNDAGKDGYQPQADLRISKTNNQTTTVPGTLVTYTIVVTNAGPAPVVGARVTDTLPAELQNPGWVCAAGAGAVCPTPATGSTMNNLSVTLGVNSVLTFTLTGTVNANATGSITNTVVVTTPPGITDPTPNNNVFTDTDTLTPRADLQIDKGNGVGSVVPGDRMTYTIVVTNAGPSAVVGARITDTLPVTLSNASWACTAGAGTVCGTASGVDNIENISVTMAPISVLTFTVTGTVISTATGFITNTAVVAPPPGVTDPTPGNNTSSDNDPLTPLVNLGIFKTNNQSTVVPGTRITYTIVVSNNGPSAATGVAISDAIPSTLLSPAWSCAGTTCNSPTSGSGNISTSVTLLPGARVTFTVVATLSLGATGRLTNTASLTPPPGVTNTNPVTESTDGDPITPAVITGTIFVDTNGNGQLNGGEPPLTGVSVIITDSQGVTRSVPVDGSGNYSVTLPPGPFTATVDPATVPPGYVLTSNNDSQTGTATPGTTGTNPVGYQPRGDVTGVVFEDTNGNQIQDPGEPGLPGVTVLITDSQNVTRTVLTGPTGVYTATGVPSGTAIVDVVNSTLPAGYVDTTNVDPSSVTVNPGVVNDAGKDGYQPQADLRISKTNNQTTTVPGTLVTYTIVVTNAGPAPVVGARVTDTLPAELQNPGWVCAAGAGAVCPTPATGSTMNNLSVTLGVNSVLTFTLTGTVNANATGSITNTVVVTTPPGITDPTPNNNVFTDTDTLTPRADLQIDKGNGVGSVVPGDRMTYTIVVTNAGPSAVVGARITDTLPVTLSNASWACTAGAGTVCGTASGLGNIENISVTMAPVSVLTFTVTGTVISTATGFITNTAVVAPPPGVTDPTPGNNTSSDNDPLTPLADLQIDKDDGVASVVPGTQTTYRITVTNNGLSAVTGATVSDTLPAALTNATWTCATCNSPASGSGNISTSVTLLPGQSAVIVLTATVAANATGNIVNTAVVTTPAGVTDTVPTNNTDTDTNTLNPQADLRISKTNNLNAVVPGMLVTYTVVVTNAGPSAVTGALITDTLPAELQNPGWVCSAGAGATCPVPSFGSAMNNLSVTMGVNSVLTFTLTGTVAQSATGLITNTAVVTVPAGVTDPTPDNNESIDADPADPRADLSIDKDDGVTTATPGLALTYRITVTNNGPSAVTGATVSDTLPAALTNAIWTCATCVPNNGSGGLINTSVSLLSGQFAVIIVTGTVAADATGSITNTAAVTVPAGVTDPTPGNNTDTDIDNLVPSVDLAVRKSVQPSNTVVPGTALTYTVVVSNAGPSKAVGATVTDTFPVALTGATWACVAGAGAICGTSSGSGSINGVSLTLAVNSAVTFTVNGIVVGSATGNIVNTAVVTTPAGSVDPTPINNTSTVTNPLTPQAFLGIFKTDNQLTAVPGTRITYTVAVTNGGPSDANGVVISDAIPAVLLSPAWTCAGANGGVCNAPTSGNGNISTTVNVPAGGQITFTVVATLSLSATGKLTNTASLTPPPGLTNTNPVSESTDVNDITPAVITGMIFVDTNGNGQLNPGEPGLPGVSVIITDSQGVTRSVPVDSNGNYTATLPPGPFTTTVNPATVPPGYVLTSNNSTQNGSATPGVTTPTAPVGYQPQGTVTGFVYIDYNGNGTFSTTTDVPLQGVTVTVLSQGKLITAVTDASGFFTATGVPSGTATVDLINPPPYQQTQGNNPTPVTVFPNQNNFEENNGFFVTGSITGTVFQDTNGDSDQDPGELGIPNVTVLITDSLGVTRTVTTGPDGVYTATLVPSGTATVDVVDSTLPPGLRQTAGTDPSTVNVVPDTTQNAGIDGYQPTATVGNRVWEDFNYNGIQDNGEPGIPGVTVNLQTPTGTLQTTTDANGLYTFTNLIPNAVHTMTFIAPAGGYTFTAQDLGGNDATDSDPNPSTGVVTFTLAPAQVSQDYDAGLWRPMTLGNSVWFDANNNGVQDSGEAGAQNVAVQLYRDVNGNLMLDAGDALVTSASTDAGGLYTFTNQISGTYIVVITSTNFAGGALLNYQSSDGAAAGNSDQNGVDHGIVNGTLGTSGFVTGAVTLIPGTEPVNDGDTNNNTNLTLDFGFYSLSLAGNLVWQDFNNNGLYEPALGETPIPSVTVLLLNSAGTPLLTTQTDAGGLYTFTNLVSGTYQVQVVLPAGYVNSTYVPTQTLGIDNDDNGVTTTLGSSYSSQFTLVPGATQPINNPLTASSANNTLDFGLWQPMTLGGQVWNDRNNANGLESGEPLFGGVVVELYAVDGNGLPTGAPVSTTTTVAGGYYTFTNLLSGTFAVVVTSTNFAPGGVLAGYGNSDGAPVTDNNVDNDDDGRPFGAATASGPITLVPGTEPGGNVNTTVDFGFYTLSLGGAAWNDVNNNGVQDAGEAGLSGYTVNLYRVDTSGQPIGGPVSTTTTGASGQYTFTGLISDTYMVEIVPQGNFRSSTGVNGAPTGPFEPAPAVNGNNAITDDNGNQVGSVIRTSSIRLSAGTGPTNDDGDANTNFTVGFGLFPPISIGNQVWNDANNNGLLDNNEAGIDGVTMNVYSGTTLVSTTVTGGGGFYTFTNLIPGDYVIEVVPPAGFVSSSGSNGNVTGPYEPAPSPNNGIDGDDNGTTVSSTVRSSTVNVAVGGGIAGTNVYPTVDFGLMQPATIGDRVWNDAVGNGIQDNGETGLVGAQVVLYDAISNTPIATTTTGADGRYTFTKVIPGSYYLVFPLPVGYGRTGADANGNTQDTLDSDANANGQTPTFSVVAGETRSDLDAGFFQFSSIGDRVWNDLNANGLQDNGEPGVTGVTVTLFSNGVPVSSTLTDNTGFYAFVNITPGVPLSVQVAVPAGYLVTAKNAGSNEAIDNDADANGATDSVTIVQDTFYQDLDIALWAPLTLGGQVWDDQNNNGAQQGGEPPKDGVLVRLYRDSNSNSVFDAGDEFVQQATTSNGGAYTFTSLIQGNYLVVLDASNFAPGGVLAGYKSSDFNDTTDSNNDGLDDGRPATGGAISSGVIRLVAGEEPGGLLKNENTTVDFGMWLPASLGGVVWLDVDHDGQQDAGEPLRNGVPVTLRDAQGNVVSTTTTGVINGVPGSYRFDNLIPGSYNVTFPLPADCVPPTSAQVNAQGCIWTFPNQGSDATDSDVNANGQTGNYTLVPGQNETTVGAGYWRPATLVPAKSTKVTGPVKTGDVITYTLEVRNTGDTFAAGVVITDPLPNGVSFVSASDGGQSTPSGIVWRLPDIAPGQTVAVQVVVRVGNPTGNTLIVNVFTVANDGLPGTTLSQPSNEVSTPFAPTAVTLSAFDATVENRGVRVTWQTALERNTFGFLVLRSMTGNRTDAVQVNAEPIVAVGPSTYSVMDEAGSAGATYWLQEIELDGDRIDYGPVVARAALPGVTQPQPNPNAGGVIAPQPAPNGGNAGVGIAGGGVAVQPQAQPAAPVVQPQAQPAVQQPAVLPAVPAVILPEPTAQPQPQSQPATQPQAQPAAAPTAQPPVAEPQPQPQQPVAQPAPAEAAPAPTAESVVVGAQTGVNVARGGQPAAAQLPASSAPAAETVQATPQPINPLLPAGAGLLALLGLSAAGALALRKRNRRK
jgi:uncharacterized repeat protein (TIGR01451 family)